MDIKFLVGSMSGFESAVQFKDDMLGQLDRLISDARMKQLQAIRVRDAREAAAALRAFENVRSFCEAIEIVK